MPALFEGATAPVRAPAAELYMGQINSDTKWISPRSSTGSVSALQFTVHHSSLFFIFSPLP